MSSVPGSVKVPGQIEAATFEKRRRRAGQRQGARIDVVDGRRRRAVLVLARPCRSPSRPIV